MQGITTVNGLDSNGEWRARLSGAEGEIERLRDRIHEHANHIQGVKGKIDAHERVCAERWEQARATMVRVESAITGLYGKWWIATTAIIALLVAMCGFLIVRTLFP